MPQTKGNCVPTFSDKASKCAPSFCQCIKESDSVWELLIPYWECFMWLFMGQNENLDLNFPLLSSLHPPCRLWWKICTYFSKKFVKKKLKYFIFSVFYLSLWSQTQSVAKFPRPKNIFQVDNNLFRNDVATYKEYRMPALLYFRGKVYAIDWMPWLWKGTMASIISTFIHLDWHPKTMKVENKTIEENKRKTDENIFQPSHYSEVGCPTLPIAFAGKGQLIDDVINFGGNWALSPSFCVY